ncbi:exonuclease domain-containing protein [Corynebacterium confusum]|uniref:exonuclease domain-containing protein n=1 Tax=uncultured Corynebacterium sp. TaxID=159447 RepID=UPI0025E11A87|nr:exonuclease domain-containing protein [uncultured Corynebacterium sp.]
MAVSLPGYAVVDFETTGFGATDRIIEIGTVLLDHNFRVEGAFETLVQPDRDVPNSFVHQLSASDLVAAPRFADIAGRFAAALSGRVLVAHNAPFEVRFLGYEFGRLGIPLAVSKSSVVDTQVLSHQALGKRKLAEALDAVGISNRRAHSALADAEATAALLRCLVRDYGVPVPAGAGLAIAAPSQVGAAQPAALFRRDDAAKVTEEPQAWLARLAQLLPPAGGAEGQTYRGHLAAALADKKLSASELKTLEASALESGLGLQDVLDIHEDFLRQLAVEAWLDGVVTPAEQQVLNELAAQLGLPDELVGELVARPVTGKATVGVHLAPGDRVTFTGALDLPRETWESRARAAGLDVGGVTKRSVLVVSANPDSMSGKAKKARSLGVPIVDEKTFGQLLKSLGAVPVAVPAPEADEAVAPSASPSSAAPAAEDPTEPAVTPGGAANARFPWFGDQLDYLGSQAEAITAAIARGWVRSHASTPLVELSPVLAMNTPLEFNNSSVRKASALWQRRFPVMLEATVHDLGELPGVGKVKLHQLVETVVLAALDALNDPEAPTAPAAESEATGGAEVAPSVYADEDAVATNGLAERALGWLGLDGPLELASAVYPDYDHARSLQRLWDDCMEDIAAACGADERKLTIVRERWGGGATLDEVGQGLGLTRERVRQIEKTLREAVDSECELARATAQCLAEHIGTVRDAAELDKQWPGFQDSHTRLGGSPEEVLRAVFGLWETDGQLLARPGFLEEFPALVEAAADGYGLINLPEFRREHGILEEAWTGLARLLRTALRVGDYLLVSNSQGGRSCAMLLLHGEPMTAEEIAEITGDDVRGVRNQLAVDPRAHRVGNGSYGLTEWGLDEYRSLADWIAQRVEERGEVTLEELFAEAGRLNVSENSIRAYADSGDLETVDGVVRKTERAPELLDADIQESRGLAHFDGAWHLLLEVTSDHLRGSGFGVSAGIAAEFGVPVGGEQQWPSHLGEVSLRVNRLRQASLSTIRRFLEELGAEPGQRVWLRLGAGFEVTPAEPRRAGLEGLDEVLNAMGLAPVGGGHQDKMAVINSALGCRPDAPVRRSVAILGHRRQDQLADLIRTSRP